MAAKKSTLPVDDKVEVQATAPVEPKAEQKSGKAPSKYDRATSRKVRDLEDAEVELTGAESPELIETLWQEMEAKQGHQVSEAEEKEGVPNMLPVRIETLQVGGKSVQFPVHFVTEVKGGVALFNERGQRISPVCTNDTNPSASYIAKAAARSNASRRSGRLPEEFTQG